MAKKRGYTLVILGLIAGLLCGFAVRELKRRIGVELALMLEEEAFSSSGCHFATDSIEVSLIRERAVAINPRVECAGVPHLQFRKIIAGFSLRRIRERIIDLELRLVDGTSLGFLSDSTTFKFIDSLSAPIAPERDTPDRYKVKLQRLTVEKLEAADTIAERRVVAQDATLDMRRTPQNNFALLPFIPKVTIQNNFEQSTSGLSNSDDIELTNLSTTIQLKDEEIVFQKIAAESGKVGVAGELTLANDSSSTLRGEVKVAGELSELSSLLTGTFAAPISISGPARSVRVAGSLTTSSLAVKGVAATEQLNSAFTYDHGEIRIAQLASTFPIGAIRLNAPIQITSARYAGILALNLQAPYSGSATIELSGTSQTPRAALIAHTSTPGGTTVQTTIAATNITTTPEFSGSGSIAARGMPTLDFSLQRLENFLARLSITGAEQSISGTALVDVRSGAGELELSAQSALIAQQVPCGILDGTVAYHWKEHAMQTGDGSLKLRTLGGGCGFGATQLQHSVDLPITEGTLHIKGLSLVSLGKPFTLDGTVNATGGVDISAAGSVDLTTVRSLIPNVDELSGLGEGKVQVASTEGGIKVSGKLNLTDVRLEQAKADIEMSGVTGPISISDNIVTFDGLNGQLNGGTVAINGQVNLSDLAQSRARLLFSNAAFEPTTNVSLVTSGELTVAQPAGVPELSGAITINSGEFSDTITLSQVLKIIERAILSRERVTNSSLPVIGLNLTIRGNRNLYINTNLGAAELASDLSVTGTLRDPQIRGDVTLRSGWIGFQNRRFEINSARLSFSPPEIEPVVDLVAETILPARTGENVLVILQGKGPISRPVISLNSDQPITERELLALVSAGGSFSSRTRANTVGATPLEGDRSLLSELANLRLRSFFSKLVDVDSLAIAPIFNPRSGLIEPALVAEKMIARSLTLFGESTLSGVEGISRARLQLDLSDDVAVGGLIEDDPSRAGVPAELQITYTPLSRQARRIDVSLKGNEIISSSEILASLRLSNISFVTPQDILGLENQLKSFYDNEGFPDATVKISCEEFVDTCTAIRLVIDEGSPMRVARVTLSGDSLPAQITNSTREALLAVRMDQRRREEFKTRRVRALIRALRSEGYVGARVEGTYQCDRHSRDCALDLGVQAGKPISFIFKGNTHFSPADFLNAIRLFERNQPFGNNTIAVLVSTIERMYRERGMLFTTVSYDQRDDPTDRSTYLVTIDESAIVEVASVEFKGISSTEIHSVISELPSDQRTAIEAPSVPLAEEIEDNALILATALRAHGYLDAQVSGDIVTIGDTNTARIEYTISSGTKSTPIAPQFSNWPSDVNIPEALIAPEYSKISERGMAAEKALQDAGYLHATVTTAFPAQNADNTLVVVAGERSAIQAIEIKGNPTISPSVIIEASKLAVGQPLAREILDEARSRLLRLGLFARVAISSLPSGGVLIEVLERSPRSVEIGTGANSEYGLHLFGEAADRQIFGDGRQLALRLDGYYDTAASIISKGTASAQFRVPLVFGSNLGLSEDLRFQRFDLATLPYDLDRWSLASFLSGEDESWTYSMGHSLIEDRLDNVSSDAVLSGLDTGSVRLSMLSGTLSYDNRDAPLNPQSGILVALDGKASWSGLGSDANFLEASPRFSWAHPLEPQWGLGYQLRFGVREPFGPTSEVPITQRYFVGGRTTVRGYRENSLGPKGALGSVQGGRYLANQNVELRYKPVEAIAVLWFVDTGGVFLNSTSLDDLRHSTGLGVRYLSPVGPIGFDVGFPLARKEGEDTYRLHFSIGTIF